MIDFNETHQREQNQCSECGGWRLGGEKLHRCASNINGVQRDLYWCIECAEYISSASWDWEERGPYPYTVTVNARGHA
jgi:hypothetical protein